jgi:hypothetical protein
MPMPMTAWLHGRERKRHLPIAGATYVRAASVISTRVAAAAATFRPEHSWLLGPAWREGTDGQLTAFPLAHGAQLIGQHLALHLVIGGVGVPGHVCPICPA